MVDSERSTWNHIIEESNIRTHLCGNPKSRVNPAAAVSVVSNELSTSYIYRRFNCLFSNKYTDPRTIVILDKYFYSSGSKGNIGLTPLFHITLFVEEHRDICCDFVLRPGDETRTERPKSFSSHLSVQQPNC